MEEDGCGVEDPLGKKPRLEERTKSGDGTGLTISNRVKATPRRVGSCSESQYKYKERQENSQEGVARNNNNIKIIKKKMTKPDPPTIAVMFVDQTVGGVLAKRLQEVEDRLAEMTGYRVRITEMSGSQLCRMLPSTNPWGNQDCQRGDCFTCSQSGENQEDCQGRNLLYETMCELCNKEVVEGQQKPGSKWKEFKTMVGVYVGETARSLYERIGEHWQDVKGGKEESHMLKHWQECHSQEDGDPKFRVRKVGSFRDPLTRQISESVRIDLRGENVLNSKTEYSRCRLPRLTIDKEVWKTAKKEEERMLGEEGVSKELEQEEYMMLELRHREADRIAKKRKIGEGGGKKKRMKLDPLLNWGNEDDGVGESEERSDIRVWLGLEEVEQNIVMDIPKRKDQETTKKLKQLEWNFARILDKDGGDGGVEMVKNPGEDMERKGSIKKRKKTLKQLAATNL